MFNALTGKYDKLPAHLTVYSGAGGEDAKDWADMVFRMYFRYAQKRGWKASITHDREMEIRGDFVYGSLKKEAGVHRLVRISPFSAKKLRHTSFVLVEVVPILPDVEHKKLQIPASDLRIDTFRSSGPGGQNVNKLETAVRITHLPTGVVSACQTERSQLQNKERAMALLKSKLLNLMVQNQKKELSDLRVKVKPEWGSQIRSYVLHPYKLVKDMRTGHEETNAEAVLDGELSKFIEAFLKHLNQ